MTKRDEAVEKLLTDFAEYITPEIYWKLFIFRYFSHHKQKKANTPKQIKKRIMTECENQLIFARFPEINKENLKATADTYMSENNIKIRRHQRKCTCIQQLPRLIGVTNIQKIFIKKYPSPFMLGYYSPIWKKEWILSLEETYFHTHLYNLSLTKTLNESDLLKYYLSNPNFIFNYVYTAIKEYKISASFKVSLRPDRQYDYTAFFYLFGDNPRSNPNTIYLDKKYESQRSEKYAINLNWHLTALGEKAKKITGQSKTPVLLMHAKKMYMQNYFIPNLESTSCPVFFFESYTHIIDILKGLRFKNPKITERKKNLLLFLNAMETCSQEADRLEMNESGYIYDTQDQLKEDKLFYSDKVKNIFISSSIEKKS